MPLTKAEFASRLRAVLEHDGAATLAAQRARLRSLGIADATARRWLAGTCRPREGMRLGTLAEALGVSDAWLWGGDLDGIADDPRTLRIVLEHQNGWPAPLAESAMRFMFRFRNGDARARNLYAMVRRGELDLLVAMKLAERAR
jgi:hypothetical protein